MPGNYEDTMCKCENLEGLLKAERPALNAAFGHRRYLISKRMSKSPDEIDWDEAKEDFMNRFFGAWSEGYKMAYCTYVCEKRDECELKNEEIEKWTRYTPK